MVSQHTDSFYCLIAYQQTPHNNKDSKSYILVSSLALISIKANIISDSLLLIRGLLVLERYYYNL